jgi:hypothetical protein
MRFLNADPIGFAAGSNWYAYASNSPLLFIDPTGLWSWKEIIDRALGGLRAVGGVFEVGAGSAIAVAASAGGAATSWTGIGVVVGAAGVAGGAALSLHGLDQIQAGLRQAWTGKATDSLTSTAMQAAGVSRNVANGIDAGISIVGSMGAGAATAGIKVSTIAATDSAAANLNSWQILWRNDIGSKALRYAEFKELGGHTTTSIAKYNLMKNKKKLETKFYESLFIALTPELMKTGPTAMGNIGVGVLSGVSNGVTYFGNNRNNKK